MTRWRSSHQGSDGWHGRISIGRLEFGWHIYRHRYSTAPDRWVLQPFLVIDRTAQLP